MRYTVYGLILQTDLPVAGLTAADAGAAPDVRVWFAGARDRLEEACRQARSLWHVRSNPSEADEAALRVWRLGDGAYFQYRYIDGTEFVIDRGGTQVWVTTPPELTIEDSATYLLGPVLGFVLRLRGLTCLHASAFCQAGRAIALLGPAGAGKSTTAAAFARLGYPILCDDVLVLKPRQPGFWIEPGYPRLRLWPESAQILYGSAEHLPRLTPTWDKRYLDVTASECRFQRQAAPLGAVYVLGERRDDASAPCVQDMAPAEAMMALIAHAYANYVLDKPMRRREFTLLDGLVKAVPVRRVVAHADGTHLNRLCEVILADWRRLECRPPTTGGPACTASSTSAR